MIRRELNLRLANSPGALAAISRVLSDSRVNVLAMALDPSGQLRLVVDNPVHAAGTLRQLHHQVTERDVLMVPVPNVPGALAPVLALVTDAGINIEYAYAGAGETTQGAVVVLGVEDAIRAAAAAGV